MTLDTALTLALALLNIGVLTGKKSSLVPLAPIVRGYK
tara:strand:+ start:558 stop:671 length:114 start_codon:yes stop_codon:yes gene_type:complete